VVLLLVDEGSTLLTLDEKSCTGKIGRSDDPPAALSEAAYWDLFRKRLNAIYADLQGVPSAVARDSSVRMRTDYRRLPEFVPQNGASGAKARAADAAPQPGAGCEIVALTGVPAGMSPAFEGGLIRRLREGIALSFERP
jgi:hypothetical protein